MSFYTLLIKPLLFLLDPERAHYLTFSALKSICRIPGGKALLRSLYNAEDPALGVTVAGIRFPNRVGLAAGLDKDARMVDEFACLGFGFIEIGTVTPLPQPGNDRPRLFRLPADSAIINRMGFNNEGVQAAADRLRNRRAGIIVGGNIGRNKITSNANAGDDYEKCFHILYDVVDYFVVNVSSPNTPGLRELQEKKPLMKLLQRLQELNTANGQLPKGKPIFLKIAPDLTNEQLDEIIDIVNTSGIAGIVATNTTTSRTGLHTPAEVLEKSGAGGLSGMPLQRRSSEVIRYLHEKSNGTIPIIGVGGIHSPEDALEKLRAGASLIQLYTGFIYEGPGLVKRIHSALKKSL